MRSHRSYRPALDAGAARSELKRCAGTQFDERVVEAFIELLEAGLGDEVAEAERFAA
jgi:HD-GYP domain-containing protein (c-di-GMP phosphodiesterase class II)